MARFIVPLEDFTKRFEIRCKNEEEIERFENNNTIWGYEPFLNYMEAFDDNYGYAIYYSTSAAISSGRTYTYEVKIYKIKK